MSIKSKHSTSKNEKSGKKAKRKKSEESEDMESSEEELDLTKDCHPIGYYVNDRAEMINQMFSVIKGNKLKAMLPPILRDCDLDLLKLQCLDQLLGMSEKRIACILEGEILETSSESDVESNEYDSDERNKTSSCSSSDGSEESVEDGLSQVKGKRQRRGKRKANAADGGKSGKVGHGEPDPPAAEQGKTLLEILELEMRARAIRALLKQNETGQEGANAESKGGELKENGVKEMDDEVVDLTGCEDEDVPVAIKKENTEEMMIDEKVSTFEEKIEKSQVEKGNQGHHEEEKAKRLQAELELRNKLFKKKIYRTRQQRMENDELEMDKTSVKQESAEPEEFLIEDPEEGEVSSSEDEARVRIKQEATEANVCSTAAEEAETSQTSHADSQPAPADPGSCVNSDNAESARCGGKETGAGTEKKENEDDTSDSRECFHLESEDDVLNIETQETSASLTEEPESASRAVEETSWRDRWLRKDGMQKLVKSSKIYAKVKKRIAEKSQRSKEETNLPNDAKTASSASPKVEVIEGSIKEYEKLVGKTLHTSHEADRKTQSPGPGKEKCEDDVSNAEPRGGSCISSSPCNA